MGLTEVLNNAELMKNLNSRHQAIHDSLILLHESLRPAVTAFSTVFNIEEVGWLNEVTSSNPQLRHVHGDPIINP